MSGGAALIRGDALRIPLADESVDLVCTSPPFWALRSYSDAGEHYPGQLGSEPHWRDFLFALWAATAEMARVLKPGGSIFLNLGDKYNSAAGVEHRNQGRAEGAGGGAMSRRGQIERGATVGDIREKSLLLLPELYRAGCTGALAALGGPDPGLNLIARAVIVQSKTNSLPESVNDRVRRSHEDWVHLVKQGKYYAAVDEIREPHTSNRETSTYGERAAVHGRPDYNGHFVTGKNNAMTGNPLGKLPGSVWSLPSEPLVIPEATKRALNLPSHYAAFGSEIVRRLVLGFSPPGICTGCGEGRVPVVNKQGETWRSYADRMGRSGEVAEVDADGRKGWAKGGHNAYQIPPPQYSILGYACPCVPSTRHPGTGEPSGPDKRYADHMASGNGYANVGAGFGGKGGLGDRPKVGPWTEYHLSGWKAPSTRPAVILDPFVGSGTTVLVAKALGRFGVGIDLSADYLRLARWRVFDSGAAAKTISRTNLERQTSLL